MDVALLAAKSAKGAGEITKKLSEESHTGWFIGLGIGFAIVAVVVVLVATILTYAARIGDQTQEGIVRMDEARSTTAPVWNIRELNSSATSIWRSAEAATQVLTEKLGGGR